jgi:GH24 family phage-related lysozyme (muramidase)
VELSWVGRCIDRCRSLLVTCYSWLEPTKVKDLTALHDMLEQHEGSVVVNGRHMPYDDKTGRQIAIGSVLQGNITIGIGRNLTARGLSEDEKEYLLANDIADNEAECLELLPWLQSLDIARYQAILDICFNIGAANFARKWPNTIALIQARQWGAVASALRGSLWHQQVGARADHIINIIETGTI